MTYPFQLRTETGRFSFHLDRNPAGTWDKTPMVVGRKDGEPLCQAAPDTLFDALRAGEATLLAAWQIKHSEALKIARWLLGEAGPALVAPSDQTLALEALAVEQEEFHGPGLARLIGEVAGAVDEWDEQIMFRPTDSGYVPL